MIEFRKLKANEVDLHGDMYTEDCLNKLFESPKYKEALDVINNIDIANESTKELHLQHSVRYKYNKIRLAINDKSLVEEYKTWCEYYNDDEKVLEKGYFYVVDGADIISVAPDHLIFKDDCITFKQNLKANKRLYKTNMNILKSLLFKLYKLPWYKRIFNRESRFNKR